MVDVDVGMNVDLIKGALKASVVMPDSSMPKQKRSQKSRGDGGR